MRLYEEYCRRHKIKVPIVPHERLGSMLFKTDKETSLGSILTFKWVDGGIHPGHYFVEYFTAMHNGFLQNQLFHRHHYELLAWDEYEEFWLAWAARLKTEEFKFIDEQREVTLAAWEIFIFCCDDWLCEQRSELKCYIHNSIDMNGSLNDRYIGYQNSLIYLTARHPAVLKAWKFDVLSKVQNYSYWLADLVKPQPST